MRPSPRLVLNLFRTPSRPFAHLHRKGKSASRAVPFSIFPGSASPSRPHLRLPIPSCNKRLFSHHCHKPMSSSSPSSSFSTTAAPSSSSSSSLPPRQREPIFSSTADIARLQEALAPLLLGQEGGKGKWELTTQGNGLERSFRFKTFKRTWEFMDVVAQECKVQKHHPEWSNVYNTTFIRWTTHAPPGLSEKDVIMAKFCDEKAEAMGEVLEDTGGKQDVGRELADRVAREGKDCCVPKKK